jgi:hypothetical protein
MDLITRALLVTTGAAEFDEVGHGVLLEYRPIAPRRGR